MQGGFLSRFLEKKSQVFTVKYGVNCGLVIYHLYCVEICFPLCTFKRIFTINGCWILSKAFFSYIEHMSFVLQFVNMVYHIDWFVAIKPFLHPWDKTHFIMVYEPLMYGWTHFANILLRIFESMLIIDSCLYFSFSVVFCLGLVSGWCWVYRMSSENVPSCLVHWNGLRKLGVY